MKVGSYKLFGQLALLLIVSALLYLSLSRKKDVKINKTEPNSSISSSGFTYYFDSEGTLEESEDSRNSTSHYWWLDSGGLLIMKDGMGATNIGGLTSSNRWQRLYSRSSPTDTNGGQFPQNLFRLITQGAWLNTVQEASFYLEKYNLSNSTNRNESNGVLLLSRYVDSDNLYYSGLRVDGYSVIKKKYKGKYYILAEEKVFAGDYNRSSKPNLIPTKEWIGLRSEVRNTESGVRITLFMKRQALNEWVKILEAIDTGEEAETIDQQGHGGIRTDFLDVKFENYRTEQI